ncbi:MAG: NUDIX domain-containing protein [Thermoplasmata archaeon]
MATQRVFCRFTRGTEPFSVLAIPEDGICLSSFLVLSPPGEPDHVLAGRMNPAAPWDHLGGLGPERVEAHRHGWMLPSSQLLLGEGPEAAAQRILTEQVGGIRAILEPVRIASEVYPPRRFPEKRYHWDLQFLFRGTAATAQAPRHPAWTELQFVDVAATPRRDFARSHDEILELVGLAPGGRTPSLAR